MLFPENLNVSLDLETKVTLAQGTSHKLLAINIAKQNKSKF